MGTILVTGGGGNVGREVVAACVARGLPVVSADRSLRPGPVPARKLDFLDAATWEQAMEGVDRLFLLRPPPVSNVKETLNPFCTLARARGVQHVVFLSVQGAGEQTYIPHHAVEKHLQAMGGGFTLLRPGFFAQNFQDAYRQDIVEDQRIYVPAGDGRVAFVDLRDVGQLAAKILEDPAPHDRAAYTLTGPKAFTFAEAAAILTDALGRPIRYQPASMAGYAWHVWRHRRLPAMQALVQTVLHVGLRRGNAEAVDPSLARLLGHPTRTLADFLTDEARLWRTPG